MEILIDSTVLTNIKQTGNETFGEGKWVMTILDTSCCGAIANIELHSRDEMREDVILEKRFEVSYKNYGFEIYSDESTFDGLPNQMRILIETEEPLKLTYDNEKMYQKKLNN